MYSGLLEVSGEQIKLGQTINFLNHYVVKVVFECGSFGIASDKGFDYDFIQSEIDKLDRCCGNKYHGIFNDNFISLFEIYWNFNCEEDYIDVLKLISN